MLKPRQRCLWFVVFEAVTSQPPFLKIRKRLKVVLHGMMASEIQPLDVIVSTSLFKNCFQYHLAKYFFRGHTYKFEEFLLAWTDELKNRDPTTMTVRLQKEVDKYKVISLRHDALIINNCNF